MAGFFISENFFSGLHQLRLIPYAIKKFLNLRNDAYINHFLSWYTFLL